MPFLVLPFTLTPAQEMLSAGDQHHHWLRAQARVYRYLHSTKIGQPLNALSELQSAGRLCHPWLRHLYQLLRQQAACSIQAGLPKLPGEVDFESACLCFGYWHAVRAALSIPRHCLLWRHCAAPDSWSSDTVIPTCTFELCRRSARRQQYTQRADFTDTRLQSLSVDLKFVDVP